MRWGGWRSLTGLRGLGLFWAGLLLLAGAGGGVLQALGPPPAPPPVAAVETAATIGQPATLERPHPAQTPAAAGAADAHAPERTALHGAAEPKSPMAPLPAASVPVRVAAPDPALLEPSVYFWPAQLPRVAADGRMSRTVYAAPVPQLLPGQPRVALLVSGFGLSDRDSRAALDALPGAVSLAVSAHAGAAAALLDAARAGGHELLASIPMEPPGWPLNDEGEKSLRTGLSAEQNRMNLEWALSRTQGVVGATAASDGMRGERFADVAAAFTPVLEMIGRRGLLYIDPRPGRRAVVPGLAVRSVDIVVDDTLARAEIEARLAQLAAQAKERGQALGLAGPLRPSTIQLIAAWAKTLEASGVALVPVSALSTP